MGFDLGEEGFKREVGNDFLRFIVSSMDDSTSGARGFFETRKRPYNPALGAPMIRWDMRCRLADAAEVQFTTHADGFIVSSPANLGMWFEFEGFSFRGYKTRRDKFPLPGGTDQRQRWFGNEVASQRPIGSKEWKGNIALLWTVSKNGSLTQLRAVRPQGFDGKILQYDFKLDLPTNAAEYGPAQARHFVAEQEEVKLIKPKVIDPTKYNGEGAERR